MKAINLLNERINISEIAFVEMVIWKVPESVQGSSHHYSYRFALVINNECAMRYDNEAGKGDHKHIGNTETGYNFTDIDRLLADFWTDVGRLT